MLVRCYQVEMYLDRQRKTKDPCPGCALHRQLCICEHIPRLNLQTRVCLVIHRKELKRTTNTGVLAVRALVNSEMRIRGELDGSALNLSDCLTAEYRSFLFFPSDDAIELDAGLLAQSPLPIQLIVPDGNWRQASKVGSRHPELKNIPRIKITKTSTVAHDRHLRAEPVFGQLLRAEHFADGMSTLQAIAEAIAIIEGSETAAPLLRLYEAKLRNTLIGRGQISLPIEMRAASNEP